VAAIVETYSKHDTVNVE